MNPTLFPRKRVLAALAFAVGLTGLSATVRLDAAAPSKKKRVLVELYTSQG